MVGLCHTPVFLHNRFTFSCNHPREIADGRAALPRSRLFWWVERRDLSVVTLPKMDLSTEAFGVHPLEGFLVSAGFGR